MQDTTAHCRILSQIVIGHLPISLPSLRRQYTIEVAIRPADKRAEQCVEPGKCRVKVSMCTVKNFTFDSKKIYTFYTNSNLLEKNVHVNHYIFYIFYKNLNSLGA